MSTTGNRGFVFSFDLAIAFIAVLLMLSLALMQSSHAAKEQAAALGEFASMQKTVFLLDSMVKNSNAAEPLLGSAIFNPETRRVESNVLDPRLLLSAKGIKDKGVLVSRVAFKAMSSGAEQTVFEEHTASRSCFALSRFVLIGGEKAVLEMKACE